MNADRKKPLHRLTAAATVNKISLCVSCIIPLGFLVVSGTPQGKTVRAVVALGVGW